MKKYGLTLRKPLGSQRPSSASTASKPMLPPPAFSFDDEDDVEKEISRQASKNKALHKVEEQHKKALQEDPSVFDYDGVYDEMKEQVARPKAQDRAERKSKYIETLMQKAKEREREHEIIYEKKQIKERNKDDHLFSDKEKFVTSAYKKKLAEREQWMEEERLRQLREEKEDVTKRKDLSGFYFDLSKNVAFGAETRPKESTGPLKHEPETEVGQTKIESSARRYKDEVDDQYEAHHSSGNQSEHSIPTAKASIEPTASAQETKEIEEASTEQTSKLYKRGEDKLAAARERFLARKKAREQ